jgi:secreted trypsin-like serine protease
MKRASILALLVLILAAAVLPAAAITGGAPDGDGHPNVGFLAAYKEGEYQWRCSGTLVHERVFLTAGHCLEEGVDEARVWFDSDMTNTDYKGGLGGHVGTPILHEEYAWGGSNPHDVGVVILDAPVEGITPAPLPPLLLPPDLSYLDQLKKDRMLEGAYFTSVGYGVTLVSWPPAELDNNKVRMVSESEYVALTKPWLHLTQRAVFEESGTCGGDSGGPAFWVEQDGDEVVVAVTSWGDPGCVATGFDYRVDTAEIRAWIQARIDEVEGP